MENTKIKKFINFVSWRNKKWEKILKHDDMKIYMSWIIPMSKIHKQLRRNRKILKKCGTCKKPLNKINFDSKKNGKFYSRCKICRPIHNAREKKRYVPKKEKNEKARNEKFVKFKMYGGGWEKIPDFVQFEDNILKAFGCKKCGKTRISFCLARGGDPYETSINFFVKNSICGKELCEMCDKNIYYQNIDV